LKKKIARCPSCGHLDQIGQNVIAFREVLEWSDDGKPEDFGELDTNGVPTTKDTKEFYCLNCGDEFEQPDFVEREI
jgi:DNA-directed RNA polymerase subunit RPC12/RpoP